MLIYDLYKTSSLSCIIIVLAHNSPQIDHSTRTHHPDSEPTHLSSYFLKLHTWQRSNKYQFCGLRFDQTCDRSMKYHNCGELANHYSTKTVNTIENPKQGNSSLFFLEVSSTLSANQKQNMIMVTMFLTDQDEIKKFYSALYFLVVSSTLSAIQPIKNKIWPWWPCFFTG